MSNKDKTADNTIFVQDYQSLQELGEQFFSNGDFVEAQRCYERAAVLAPDEAEPYIGFAAVAFQNNLMDDAETAFKVACRLNRNCAKGYAGLAMVAQKKGEYSRAFDMYLKCLERDSDNMTALLGLFQSSCQMGSFTKIIHYLELYLKTHQKDSSVMFSLASLYIKEERFEDSRKMLLNLLALDGENEDAAGLLEEVEHDLTRISRSGDKAI